MGLTPPATPIEPLSGWARYQPLVRYVLPLVSIFVVVIGAMSGGIATPTESAALRAIATMALAAAYGALSWDAIKKALRGTIGISGMVLFIILGATTFSQILSFSGATEGIVSAIFGQELSPFAILAGMMLLLIFLGIFVDQVSMMLITLPVFMPIVQRLDIDLIWFGVLYLICMQLGLLLPPHGLLLMTMRGVAPPEVAMADIFRAVVLYVMLSLVLLVFIIASRPSPLGCRRCWGNTFHPGQRCPANKSRQRPHLLTPISIGRLSLWRFSGSPRFPPPRESRATGHMCRRCLRLTAGLPFFRGDGCLRRCGR
jgi:TRAP-type mannitol/chloroaromatic compound transport system permease large subunit